MSRTSSPGGPPADVPRADVRLFLQHALRWSTSDPDGPPPGALVAWHRRLAVTLGVLPRHPHTNRQLLDCALRLQRLMRGLPDPLVASPPYDPRRAQASAAASVTYPSPA